MQNYNSRQCTGMLSSGDKVQLGYVAALWILNTVGLQILNHWQTIGRKKPTGYILICSNYALLCSLLFGAVCMDTYFPTSNTYIGLVLITMKANASSFTLALLDFYFSSVEYVSLRTIIGALTWSSTACVSMWILTTFFGGWDQMLRCKISDLLNPTRLLAEYCRFVALLLFSGLITDLIFSPMHRLTHSSRWLYTRLHSRHHEFRSRLTSLVLFSRRRAGRPVDGRLPHRRLRRDHGSMDSLSAPASTAINQQRALHEHPHMVPAHARAICTCSYKRERDCECE